MASNMKLAAVGLIGATMISLGGVGIVSAATQGSTAANTNITKNTKNTNVGQSGIPRSVFRTDLLDSTAKALNTTTANVKSAHKNHSLKSLVKNAGLTKKQFALNLKNDLTSDLESQGYSSQQVTIALQQRIIEHFRHEEKLEHHKK